MSELTPLMKQYFGVKRAISGRELSFSGSEISMKCSVRMQKLLHVSSRSPLQAGTRTGRPDPDVRDPALSADSMSPKLIRAGHKVAICEQVEDPKQAKGIVQREVIKVITPAPISLTSPRKMPIS